MKINNTSKIDAFPKFGAKIDKNFLPLIARAKGSCPLHKKPLLDDAIKTIKDFFPYNRIFINNKEIQLSLNGLWTSHVTLSKLTKNALDDVRAAAASLEWKAIDVRKYSKPTSEQKIAIEHFNKKWGAFLSKRNK